MIEEKRDCIDILTQISSVVGAIMRVEENILHRHLRGCVDASFRKGCKEDRERKTEEIIQLLQKFRKYVCRQKFDNNPEKYIKQEQRKGEISNGQETTSQDKMKSSLERSIKSKSEKIDPPLVGMSGCKMELLPALARNQGVQEK